MSVVTRFAPSPTGFLHIGGARTALFNWLFARHHGGQFLLRIEDTDKERSTEEAKQAILDGMQWLGLQHDGEVVYQSERAARHAEVAQQLLDAGHAYKCFLSKEELEELRAKSRESGSVIRSPWRDRTDYPEGEHVVRVKAPLTNAMIIQDEVQGEVNFPSSQLDDFVILRSDGSPTYMLAVVVDDFDMGITHIIRGDDHLNNAARQKIIYDAMGWDVPAFAHIPLIHGPDGAKLSKRHGALGVEAYEEMGYLPEALRNYLLRLGWSHGDDEIISTAQAVEWFDTKGLGKSASRFDFAKLENLNGHYIRQAGNDEIIPLLKPFIAKQLGREITEEEEKLLRSVMIALKERAKTLVQLAETSLFLFRKANPPADDKAKSQLQEGTAMLQAFIAELESQSDWTHDALFSQAKAFAETQGTKLGQLMAPVRVAITGSTASPSMFDVLAALGKEESIERLKAAC